MTLLHQKIQAAGFCLGHTFFDAIKIVAVGLYIGWVMEYEGLGESL